MTDNPINYWYQKYLAEKLTWQDIRTIRIIYDHLCASTNKPAWDSKEFYEEILKRYNDEMENNTQQA